MKNLVIEDKMKQLQKTHDILVEREIDEEAMSIYNFGSFIEQKGREEGKMEVTLLHIKRLIQRIDVSMVDTMNIPDVGKDIRPTVLQSLYLSQKAIPTVIFKELYHLDSLLYHQNLFIAFVIS